jgi:hypothetical protein
MTSDLSPFVQPGFWLALLLLVIGIAVITAVIWSSSTFSPF